MEHQPPTTSTIYMAPEPPPFPAPPRSVDLSPLEFILALLALVTIPALIYTFFFSLKCPPSDPFNWNRRRGRSHGTDDVASDASFPGEVGAGDKEAVAAVSGVKYKKEAHLEGMGSECPVCLSGFKDGEDVKVLVACKHSFHAVCVDMWLSSHSSCPVCRAPVPSGKVPPGDDRRRSAPGRRRDVDDFQQGLPDASSLV